MNALHDCHHWERVRELLIFLEFTGASVAQGGMSKPYKSYQLEQDLLLPPSLKDWLPEKHLAYFVSEVVDELDLSGIHTVYEKDARGQPPYDPRMMTKLLVYGHCVGVYSARKVQQRLTEDVAFWVLAAGNEPDFRTITDSACGGMGIIGRFPSSPWLKDCRRGDGKTSLGGRA